MKALLSGLLLFLLLSASPAFANGIERPGRFGLGGKLGYPGLSLSMNAFCTKSFSIEADVGPGWSFGSLGGDVNFLFWLHDIVKAKPLDLTWFVGPGVGVSWYYTGLYHGAYTPHDGAALFGDAHASIGLALQFNTAPVDLVFAFNPGLGFSRYGVFPFFAGGIGTRYYF